MPGQYVCAAVSSYARVLKVTTEFTGSSAMAARETTAALEKLWRWSPCGTYYLMGESLPPFLVRFHQLSKNPLSVLLLSNSNMSVQKRCAGGMGCNDGSAHQRVFLETSIINGWTVNPRGCKECAPWAQRQLQRAEDIQCANVL
jgi:hypothetical protein